MPAGLCRSASPRVSRNAVVGPSHPGRSPPAVIAAGSSRGKPPRDVPLWVCAPCARPCAFHHHLSILRTDPFMTRLRHLPDGVWVHQHDFDAGRLDFIKQAHPVNPGGFHRHRAHLAVLQPLDQSVLILREYLERSHIGFFPLYGARRHTDKVFRRANVNTCGVEVDLLQPFHRRGF